MNFFVSNPDLDPWSAGGFLTDINDKIHSILIEDGAHHLGTVQCDLALVRIKSFSIFFFPEDLRGSNAADPESVIKARLTETDIIQSWIQEHNRKRN